MCTHSVALPHFGVIDEICLFRHRRPICGISTTPQTARLPGQAHYLIAYHNLSPKSYQHEVATNDLSGSHSPRWLTSRYGECLRGPSREPASSPLAGLLAVTTVRLSPTTSRRLQGIPNACWAEPRLGTAQSAKSTAVFRAVWVQGDDLLEVYLVALFRPPFLLVSPSLESQLLEPAVPIHRVWVRHLLHL